MILNYKNIDEYAERYLGNELSDVEWVAIQNQLQDDPTLKLEWDESVHFAQTLKGAGEHQRIRNMIAEVVSKEKADQHKYNNSNLSFVIPKNTKIISFKKYLKIGSVAALIALVSSVITFLVSTDASRKDSNSQYTRLRREIENIKRDQNSTNIVVKDIKDKSANTDIPMPGNYSGTGFAVSNDGYIATDYHVVEDADSIFIQTANGKYYKSFVVSFDPNSDVALLKVENSNFKFNKSVSSLPYAFGKRRADLGQQIFTIGYPTDDVTYNEGYISAQKGYQGDSTSYQLVVNANPGQSGSPIFDKNGNIIAMLTAKQTSATYAIQAAALEKLIASLPSANKITTPNGSALSKMGRTEQVKKAMDYVCAVRVYK